MQDVQTPFPDSLEERYKQPRFISAGGGGAVYAALDKNLNKKVAIKLLNVNSGDQKLLRFQQEAKTIGKFTHNNIVTALDFGIVDEKIAYLVLDLVGDASLNVLIKKRKKLSIKTCLDLFRQICAGMSYAHAQGVLHRDLKPSNVLLENSASEYPTAKVADFGIAKIAGTLIFATTGNIYIGTPAYTSPEQFCGDDVDERSDIYSFGCLMFATLLGEPPFVGENTTELALKHANDPVPAIERTYSGEEIPVVLQVIVETCLEKDRDDRYDSFAEVEDLIVQLQKDLHSEVQLEEKNSSNEPYSVSSSNPYTNTSSNLPFQLSESGHSKQVIIAVAVLVVIIGGVVCASLLRSDTHDFDREDTATSAYRSKISSFINPPSPHEEPTHQPVLSATELARPVPVLIEIAATHVQRKDYPTANSYLDRVLKLQPQNFKALRLRSDSRYDSKDYDGAMADLEQAQRLRPGDSRLILRRAHIKEAQGDLTGAVDDYAIFLQENPDNAKNHKEHAKLCTRLRRNKEAIASYSKAIHLEPRDFTNYKNRGRVYDTIGEKQKALDDFDTAIEMYSNDAELYRSRASVCMGLKQFQKAVDDYTKAIELSDTPMYYSLRADAYDMLGRKDLAKRDRDAAQ